MAIVCLLFFLPFIGRQYTDIHFAVSTNSIKSLKLINVQQGMSPHDTTLAICSVLGEEWKKNQFNFVHLFQFTLTKYVLTDRRFNRIATKKKQKGNLSNLSRAEFVALELLLSSYGFSFARLGFWKCMCSHQIAFLWHSLLFCSGHITFASNWWFFVSGLMVLLLLPLHTTHS